MDSTQKYIVWVVVAAIVIGGGFFVYKKMYAPSATTAATDIATTAPADGTQLPAASDG